MANHKSALEIDLERDPQQRLKPLLPGAPWVLRITAYKDRPVPVLVVKERVALREEGEEEGKVTVKKILKDRGLIYGQALRRCLPVIRAIVSHVCDPAGIPLELQRFLPNGRLTLYGNLPLDEEAGAKLSLIFKLQEGIKDMDRVELIAWRVERFSREEAAYWLTRATQYGGAASRWARAGMRLILGGQPGDGAILPMLEQLRR
ncbi:MAG: hypothetical protein PWQ18_1638 [Clostridia bacterium]|nr:hypothetical protein [Clostridia bacterium]